MVTVGPKIGSDISLSLCWIKVGNKVVNKLLTTTTRDGLGLGWAVTKVQIIIQESKLRNSTYVMFCFHDNNLVM